MPLAAAQNLSPLELQLFSRTFEHPVIGPLVEWAPARWLLELANPNPSAETDLGSWNPAEPLVGMEALYANLLAYGMRDPLFVGVGRVTRRIRLEAGNHRVRVLLEKGLHRLPAVAYVGDSAITHLINGSHEGRQVALRLPHQPDIMGPCPVKEYMRLSEVLVDPPCTTP